MSNKVRRTYQQSLFNDPQLALPEHDNIVRWVDQLAKNSTDKLLNAIGYDCEHSADGKAYLWSKQRNREEFFDIVSKALQKIAHNKNAVLPKPPPVKVLSVIWEPILKNERGTTVGAMDLIITLGLPIPVLHYEIQKIPLERKDEKNFSDLGINLWSSYIGQDCLIWADGKEDKKIEIPFSVAPKSEYFIFENRKFYFINKVAWTFVEHTYSYEQVKVVVEAKTEIRSVGELMRQLNLYRGSTTQGRSKFLVVAPAHAWHQDSKEILNEQGISTLNYLSN